MATLVELELAGELIRVDAQLAPHELEERRIFLVAGSEHRLNKLVETMESQWSIETSPAEQLDDIIHHFVTGGTLDFPRQFHQLTHRRDGIWELKTPDLRLFGWFPTQDCFVCTDVADANAVKQGQYSGYCEQAWFRREQLCLDEPKFLTGDKPEDVVSNCYSSEPSRGS